MLRNIGKSLLLVTLTIVICCIVYPLVVWAVGQTVFPEQANGSLLRGPDGSVVGSRLIAQPFTKDEYFQPRPSAVSYDASASGPSNLSASNYMLRARVAASLGPMVKYRSGAPVGPDIEAWFQKDQFEGKPGIVQQWADAHNAAAQAWVKADPTHGAYVDDWSKKHTAEVEQWKKDNPDTAEPAAVDLAVIFFDDFSKQNPGKFPAAVAHQTADGKTETVIEPVQEGADIQGTFFDMWRQEHSTADLADVPADMVMASGSGLDPHITLDSAEYQLDRVAAAWAKDTKRSESDVRKEIAEVLQQNAIAPLDGLAGVKMVNVLEVNLALHEKYGDPA